jgi:hypothetical protein
VKQGLQRKVEPEAGGGATKRGRSVPAASAPILGGKDIFRCWYFMDEDVLEEKKG